MMSEKQKNWFGGKIATERKDLKTNLLRCFDGWTSDPELTFHPNIYFFVMLGFSEFIFLFQ